MSQDLSAFSREHEAFFEVRLFEVAVENTDKDGCPVISRIHAGFDVDIYANGLNGTHHPDAREYQSIYTGIQRLAESVNTTDCCEVQVIPFPATIVLDTHRQMLPLGMLRIRITHTRGIEQPAGPAEQRVLTEIERKLRDLGCRSPSGRAS